MLPYIAIVNLQRIVLFVLVTCSLIVLPYYLTDPFNFPKAVALWISAFAGLGYLLIEWRILFKSYLKIVLPILFFVFSLILVFFLNNGPIWNEIYGVYGRNTGLLTYLSLIILFLCCALSANTNLILKIRKVLVVITTIVISYGTLQLLDKDFFDWKLSDDIVGPFGNTNFYSAFLGIALLFLISQTLERNTNNIYKIVLVVIIFLGIYTIFLSNSSQGLFGLALGSFIIFYNKFIRNNPFNWLKRLSLISFSLIGLMAGLGILQIGPLSFLYQDSTSFRGDYWRAGISMFSANPLVGVGLDAYGDNYTIYRDEIAATRRGPNVVSNAAHNVFIDFLSSGGLLLFIPYFLMMVIIAISAIRIIKSTRHYDSNVISLIAAWFSYLLISIVSINQLSIAVMGWIFGGLILGLILNDGSQKTPNISKQTVNSLVSTPIGYLLASLATLAVLLTSISPALYTYFNVVASARSNDFLELSQTVKRSPESPFFLVQTSKFFLDNGDYKLSLELSRRAIAINPNELNAWRLLIANPLLLEPERKMALNTMANLDPFNPEFQFNSDVTSP